jgi:hypothetical protein
MDQSSAALAGCRRLEGESEIGDQLGHATREGWRHGDDEQTLPRR